MSNLVRTGKFVYPLCSVSIWTVVDVLHDVWTVSSSLVDIVTDILVAREFYQREHFTFFYLSVTIFIAAQLSYAFLFAGTWAQGKSSLGKICVFLCVLPFGQLIPIFAWIESFRFPLIDNFLKKLSLTPTGVSQNVLVTSSDAVESRSATKIGDDDSDSLWAYIQKKYTAHAGFLAEAFVEAIPQGVLQTVAILTLSDTSPLNVFSILMSITVVASKGYLVSYSIHRPSFAFNYLTIAADSFALFASVTWLWVVIPGVSNNPIERHPWLCIPALIGMLCCAFGGFFLLSFTMLDDHLKSIYPGIYTQFSDTVIWFEVYLVRFVGWVLAILPTSVVFLSAKFSLLPVVFFGSLDPEHAVHSKFYRPLFRFLDGNIAKERFLTRLPVVLPKYDQSTTNHSTKNRGCIQKVTKFFRDMIWSRNVNELDNGLGGVRISTTEIALEAKSRQSSVGKLNATGLQASKKEPKFGSLDRQIRLQIANRFLHKAKLKVKLLEKQLAARPPVPRYGEHVPTVAEHTTKLVKAWVGTLDTTEPTRQKEALVDADHSNDGMSALEDQMSEDLLAQLRAEAMKLRQENIRTMADDALGESASHLKARSEILRHFISREGKVGIEIVDNKRNEEQEKGCGELMKHLYTELELFCSVEDSRWEMPRYKVLESPPTTFLIASGLMSRKMNRNMKRRLHALLRCFLRLYGLFALFNITIAGICLIPSTLVFIAYSALFPLTQMHYCFEENDDDKFGKDMLLPCILSSSYALCLFGLILLAPFVSRFQLLRTDLRSAKNFPEQFYSSETTKDIYCRYVAAQSRVEVSQHVLTRVGRYNAMEIFSYLDEANHNIAFV